MAMINIQTEQLPATNNAAFHPFMVSAPGKVILLGEHAVVYGKAAIVAAISLRSYLLVTFLPIGQSTVRLCFPDIDLDHSWNINDLPWEHFSNSERKKYYYDSVTVLDPELLEAIEPYLTTISMNSPENTRKIHRASAISFLYLFLSLGSVQSVSCVYTVRSTIPIGAGMGSSGSIAVCMSTALLHQARAISGPHRDQPVAESSLQIERINRWAFVSEMCIHGRPSGVDNTISSGGQAILFKKTDHQESPTMIPLRNLPELPLLLVNTFQTRNTAAEVAKVAHLKEKHPMITNQLLDAINNVTASAYSLISTHDFDPRDPVSLQHLGELIAINHGLLVSLGVSHPKLERVRELIDDSGIGWTKLTGAGGGGCTVTLLKPVPVCNGHTDSLVADQEAALVELEKKLEGNGFEKFESSLGGKGVGVLWPALSHSSTDPNGGTVISQEKFLQARGNEAIENLVGLNSSARVKKGGRRLNWEFWG